MSAEQPTLAGHPLSMPGPIVRAWMSCRLCGVRLYLPRWGHRGQLGHLDSAHPGWRSA